jgi:D-3-phosphoglycerate dehydrogenase / 2-oxoglutarate reductase
LDSTGKETHVASGPHVIFVDTHVNAMGNQFANERSVWEGLGATVELAQCSSEAEIIEGCKDADILVYSGLYTPFTEKVLSQLPKCQLIARFGIGMDSVDLDAATKHGIVVANAAEYCVPEVADHATALILSLARRVTMMDRWVRQGHWANAVGKTGLMPRLSTQSVGFVGFGRIARRAARNMENIFGTLLAYDPYVSQEQVQEYKVRMVSLDELLEQSDYVSVHTPLMPQTRGLIGAAQLAKMKPTAYIVNTSRGPVIDEPSLIAALQANQIAGAALDVFDPEPLVADSPLRTMDNVILTPHLAAYSEQAIQDLRAAVTATVSDVIQGYWPRHVMNPKVTPRRELRRR